MKLIIDRKILRDTITTLNKVVYNSTSERKLIFFKATKDNKLILSTQHNPFCHLKVCLKSNEKNNLIVSKPGKFILDIKSVIRDLRIANEKKVEIYFSDNQLILNSGWRINCKVVDDKVNKQDENTHKINFNNSLTIKKNDFLKLIKKVNYAVANETNSTMPILKGINIKVKNKHFYLTATDSFRLSLVKYQEKVECSDFSTTINHRYFNCWDFINTPLDSEIKISFFNKEWVMFENEGYCLLIQAFSNEFPDLTEVVNDKTYKYDFTFNRNEFIRDFKDLNKDQKLRISLKNKSKINKVDEVLVVSNSNSINSNSGYSRKIKEFEINGKDLDILLNCTYLINAVNATDSENIKMFYKNGESAVKIVDPALFGLFLFISPMTKE